MIAPAVLRFDIHPTAGIDPVLFLDVQPLATMKPLEIAAPNLRGAAPHVRARMWLYDAGYLNHDRIAPVMPLRAAAATVLSAGTCQ
jgi:hypothetical protein